MEMKMFNNIYYLLVNIGGYNTKMKTFWINLFLPPPIFIFFELFLNLITFAPSIFDVIMIQQHFHNL